jgi:non-specific serine/threonine protein kinase
VGESAVVAAAGGVHGFAPALTSFIGRDGPVGEVASLLGKCRLVTVTGPGGSGKTRLAGEISKRVADRFADGVWLAELAAVRDPGLVGSVVAAVLGVREQPGGLATEAVTRALARQQLLLVLDNCEHVIAAAAGLCAGLLVACDDVTILATSREPLAVAGEARYRLAPMTLPGDDDQDGTGSEAVALFADRARWADARFALDVESGPAVARLVTRLDGMPLAIELAAARVEALGVTQLVERLDDRFALLAGGDRLAPGRHRSLAAAVEWSYQLLDEHEQRVFRHLSVFPAGFTLTAAETVAGQGAGPAVLRLVDCSLLVPPRVGPDGRLRYVMLETLRAYGAGLLGEAGEQEQVAAALAEWALGVAEQAAAGLQTRAGDRDAARWLEAEDATMRQVLAWARDHDPAAALRLAAALGWWWFRQNQLPGQYPLLREVTAHAEPGSDRWCTAQFWLGSAAFFSDDLLAEALEHFTVLSDTVAGRGPSRALADALGGRSTVLRELGRAAEAAEEGRRALAVSRELGYPFGEAFALANLAFAAVAAGDLVEAVRLARQAEQFPGDIPASIARACSVILTQVLIQAGDFAAAERACAAGLAASRDSGDLWNQQALLGQMMFLDLRAGRAAHAAAHLRESLEIKSRDGALSYVDLDYCGYLCAATGRNAEAVTAWAAYAALAQAEGYQDWRSHAHARQEPLRKARKALGPARARAAEERGAAMSAATAAEYALLLTAPEPDPAASPGAGQLSARERELVTLVAQGATDAQIAAQLYISPRTVSSHLDRIRDKTGCRRRADLTRLALSIGLI